MRSSFMALIGLLLFAGLLLAQPGEMLLNEGFETGVFPMNWTIYNDADELGWVIGSGISHTGSYHAEMESSFMGANYDDWLITPQLLPVAGDSISFWAQGEMMVSLSTTGKNKIDFSNLLGQLTGGVWDWTYYSFDLTPYAGDTIYVAFTCFGQMFGGSVPVMDDVSGPEILVPDYPIFVSNADTLNFNRGRGMVRLGETADEWLKITNMGGTDLNITAINTGSPDILVQPSALLIPSGVTDSVHISWTASQTGIDSQWVEFLHDGGSSPDRVEMTLHAAAAEAYLVDFELPEEDWFVPWGYGLTLDGVWQADNFLVHWGNQSAMKPGWSGGDTTYLYSPRLDMNQGAADMSFYYVVDGSGSDTLEVEISDNAGVSWQLLDRIVVNNPDWKPAAYDLSAFSGDSLYVRWHYISGTMDGSSIYMDDLVLPARYTESSGVVYASVDRLDYGALLQGHSSSRTVTLINAGSPLTINSITSSSAAFTISNAPASLDPFASAEFQVTFAPTKPGPAIATITIDHDGINGSREMLTIPVMGFGLVPHMLNYADDFENKFSLYNYEMTAAGESQMVIDDGAGMENSVFSGDSTLAIMNSTGTGESAVTGYFNLTGISSARLSFGWGINSYSMDDYLVVDIYDGQWHNSVDSLAGGFLNSRTWFPVEIDLSSYNPGPDFAVRFRTKLSFQNNAAYLDLLQV
ncbi:MAG: choice-of-anchor J domain-containing protein, partial [Calditrichia bacterium]